MKSPMDFGMKPQRFLPAPPCAVQTGIFPNTNQANDKPAARKSAGLFFYNDKREHILKVSL